MNILFVRRQLSAPPPPLAIPTSSITEPLEEWWGIYYHGQKIGYANQNINPTPEGYLVRDSSFLRLNLMDTVQTVRTRLEMVAGDDWALKRFDFELHSKDVEFSARGDVSPGRLRLEVNSGGHRTTQELPLTQPPYLLAALKPYAVAENLEPGREHLFATFDPATLSQQVTAVTIEGRERIRVGGAMEPAIRMRQRFKGVTVVSWIDGKGRTLKEESPAGLSLVRENADREVVIPEARSISLDLIAETAVALDAPIPDPGQKNFLKLRLSGFNPAHFSLESGRQRLSGDLLEIRREDLGQLRTYRIPLKELRFASYLQSTPFLQSDHPEIRGIVRKVLKGEADAVKAVARIKDWVYGEIAKEPTVSIPNALEVLKTRKGDCNEHTVLFNAMARAAGIPAKTVVGVVHMRGAFYYHAWSEVWLGEWISVDSVLNQFPADVTHIRFLEGEIDRQIDILELIGKLRIKVVEAS